MVPLKIISNFTNLFALCLKGHTKKKIPFGHYLLK